MMNKQIKIPLLVLGLWIVAYLGYYVINITNQYPEKILDFFRWYFTNTIIHHILGIEMIALGLVVVIFIYI